MLQKSTRRIIETAAKADGIDVATVRAAITLLEGKRMDPQKLRPLMVNQSEAARLLGVSRFMIRNLVARGVLKPVKLSEDCLRYPMVQLEHLAGEV